METQVLLTAFHASGFTLQALKTLPGTMILTDPLPYSAPVLVGKNPLTKEGQQFHTLEDF